MTRKVATMQSPEAAATEEAVNCLRELMKQGAKPEIRIQAAATLLQRDIVLRQRGL